MRIAVTKSARHAHDMKIVNVQIAKNVAPKGLPTWRRRCVSARETSRLWNCSSKVPADGSDVNDDTDEVDEVCFLSELASEVLSRKSCVTAMPMEANEREVRSQARKVRSALTVSNLAGDSNIAR